MTPATDWKQGKDTSWIKEKLKEVEKSADEAQAAKAAHTAWVSEQIEKEDLYYIQTYHKFLKFNPFTNDWLKFTVESMSVKYPELMRDRNLFFALLNEKGRSFSDCVYSFNTTDELSLNLLRYDGWIEPKEGEHHKIFDTLMKSLGSGKVENIEHLERVITWKYCHPEAYMLPCIVWWPGGSAGKGVLFDVVLVKLFHGQASVLKSNSILGDFNSAAKGKAVLLIDELTKEKVNMEKLKHTVQQKTLDVNEKYLPVKNIDNTALYFIGSNDPTAPIRIDGGKSDRRWSLIYLNPSKQFMDWINEDFNVDLDKTNEFKELAPYIDILGSEEEIAKWINYLIKKHYHKGIPSALHGEDYQMLLEQQKDTLTEFCEKIFNDPEFTYIQYKTFWSKFKFYVMDNDKWLANHYSKSNTKQKAINWVNTNYNGRIGWRDNNSMITVIDVNGEKYKVEGFGLVCGPGFFTDTTLYYENK